MEKEAKAAIAASIREFKLPEYDTIPDVGLYLEQATKYISAHLEPLEGITITGSMISNYVKRGLVANPVKKQYSREQVAYLIFIAIAKAVLSLEDLQVLIDLQKKTYTAKTAYEYFCRELENVLHHVFGLKENLDEVGVENTDEKIMLRNTIITVAHKIYLDKCFAVLREQRTKAEDERQKQSEKQKAKRKAD